MYYMCVYIYIYGCVYIYIYIYICIGGLQPFGAPRDVLRGGPHRVIHHFLNTILDASQTQDKQKSSDLLFCMHITILSTNNSILDAGRTGRSPSACSLGILSASIGIGVGFDNFLV